MNRVVSARAEPVRAAVVAIGAELLSGDVLNTNAATLGHALAGAGVPVMAQLVVADDEAAIASAIRHAAAAARVVVVCGGLGPTQDDVTREGLARAVGVPLERDQDLQATLQAGSGGSLLTLRQADVPRGARVLAPVGSAPGLRLQLGDRVIYALPGVPRELVAMVSASVLPDLTASFGRLPVVARRTVRTVGLTEEAVAEAMAPEVARAGGSPQIAFLAGGGETRVVITGVAADEWAAAALVDPVAAYARRALGEAVYGASSLEAEVVASLHATGGTVACAESLTAGMLAARLAAVPGASAVLRGGVVAYATELKMRLLGVPAALLAEHGAVSASCAESMAGGVAEACQATVGVALTGVAGPDPADGHPPGTVFVAVQGPAGTQVRELALTGDRQRVRDLSVVAALRLLRESLRQPDGAQ